MYISDDGAIITKRFFLALDVLRRLRKIRGMKTFTDAYGINYWNFYTIKKEPESHMFKPEWLTYLVIDFNVSADWLLTGRGSMLPDIFPQGEEKTATTHPEQ